MILRLKHPLLIASPANAPSGYVGSVLLARAQAFYTTQALAVEERPHGTVADEDPCLRELYAQSPDGSIRPDSDPH